MAVKLRLRREGTKKRPHYRVVAADSRSPRNGRFIEILGEYHPLDQPSTIKIENERALHWLRVGAQPTAQVQQLLRISGVWEEFKPGDKSIRDRSAATDVAPKAKLSKKAKAKLENEAEAAAEAAEEAKAAAEAAKAEAKAAKAEAKAAAEAPAEEAVAEAVEEPVVAQDATETAAE